MGYFLPHSLSVRGIGSWLHTNGGITIEQALMNPQLFPVHDRILGASYWHFGAGADYALTESLDLSFSYVTLRVRTLTSGAESRLGQLGISLATRNFLRVPNLWAIDSIVQT